MASSSSLVAPLSQAIPIDQEPDYDTLDINTLTLIAGIGVSDLETILSRRKGKGREDAPMTDEEYAHQLQMEQYTRWLTVGNDAQMAKSMEGAMDADEACLQAIAIAEEAEREDRRFAEMLDRGEALPPATVSQTRLADPAFVLHPSERVAGQAIPDLIDLSERISTSKGIPVIDISPVSTPRTPSPNNFTEAFTPPAEPSNTIVLEDDPPDINDEEIASPVKFGSDANFEPENDEYRETTVIVPEAGHFIELMDRGESPPPPEPSQAESTFILPPPEPVLEPPIIPEQLVLPEMPSTERRSPTLIELPEPTILPVLNTRRGARPFPPQLNNFPEFLDSEISNIIGQVISHFSPSPTPDLPDDVYREAMLTAEEAEREDRLMAEMLERGEDLPPPKPCQLRLTDPSFVLRPPDREQQPGPAFPDRLDLESPSPDDSQVSTPSSEVANEFFSTFARASNAIPQEDTQAERSTTNVVEPIVIEPRVECIICCEIVEMKNTLRVPCHHRFCRHCIIAFVERCTQDETVYPLQCCLTPIPNETLSGFIPVPLLRLFEKKEKEYRIPASQRVYCGEPTCALFIGVIQPPSIFGAGASDEMRCSMCLQFTCTRCKNLAHRGDECPLDKAERTFKELAKRQSWPTCPGCSSTVEKLDGCDHMVCRCKMEFCYRCMAPWRNHVGCT